MLIITWRWGGRCHTHSEAPPTHRNGRLTVRRIYALCQQSKKLHSIFSREAQSKLQNISVTSWILDLLLQEHGNYTPPAAALQMQCLPEMGRGVKKTCRWHVFSLRSRRLCRRSIHRVLRRTILNSLPQSRFARQPPPRGSRGRTESSAPTILLSRKAKTATLPSDGFLEFSKTKQ